MKVTIKNLGAVREAEIELKPLTVFVGPNNTGKTWTANIISAILGPYGWGKYANAYSEGKVPFSYPPLEDAVKRILEEGNAKIDLVKFFEEFGSAYFNNVALLAPQWTQMFLGTRLASFKETEFKIALQNQDIEIKEILDSTVNSKFSISKKGEALLSALKESGDTSLYFFTAGSGILEKFPVRAIKEFIVRLVFQVIHRALYNFVYIFPAERTAFAILAMSAKINRKTDADEVIKNDPRADKIFLGDPIVMLMNTVTQMRLIGSHAARIEQAKNDKRIENYLKLAEILQNDILEGHLDFSTPEPDPLREVVFQPNHGKGIDLDMPIVSSMVKELSMFVLYLLYEAKPNDLLVIDEPEMHLHPEAQAKFTEFLAMLINAGLNIIITTHSPYLVDHLINLVKAAEHNDLETLKEKFFLKRSDAFIPKNKVSAYLFEKNTAKNIMDESGFIDWETFGEVSDRIMQLRLEL
ncbi:MAG: AAA family ATPase [Methanothrix sp.]|nr:AAA family ATPase [Methanothrix sp.]